MNSNVAGTLHVPSAIRSSPALRASRGRHTEHTCYVRVTLLVAWIASAQSTLLRAEDTTPPMARFRRVYVAEDPKTWPASDSKYLPMEAEEFKRLVAKIERQSPVGAPTTKSQPVAAYYEAHLGDKQVLVGSGTLDVAADQPAMSTMSIDPCTLALDRPQWLLADSSPATLGLSNDGKQQLLVEHTGPMLFDWSLAPDPSTAESTTYTIDLPRSAVNHFWLELPDKLVARCDGGLLVHSSDSHGGLRRWHFELGGQTHFRLVVGPANVPDRHTTATVARQTSTYEISLRGVEAVVQWRLERRREPLDEVIVVMESPLVPVAATFNGDPVAWSTLEPAQGDRLRLRIAMPASMGNEGGLLRLKSIAPVELGKPWKLPRVMTEGVFWQEGQTSLLVSNPLRVDRLTPAGCRQVDVKPLPAAGGGESLDFDSYTADASISLTLNEWPASIQAIEGVSTSLDRGKFSSRVVSDFQSTVGSQFMLQATVLPQWTIDNIQTVPAAALDDWSVETRGKNRTLVLRLSRPLAQQRPLRITVLARRPNAGSARILNADDVVPLRYLALAGDRRLVMLHIATANQLQVDTGDPKQRLDSLSLTAAERDRFGESTDSSADEPIFVDDPAASVHITIGNRRSVYDAMVSTSATISGMNLREDYQIECTPAASTQLERVLVRFNQRRENAPRWSITGLDKEDYVARALASANESEEWELSFHRPQKARIDIHCFRESKLAGPTAVSLASVPDAATQQGKLVIENLGPRPSIIRNARLTAIKSAEAAAGRFQTVRATYSYDPQVEQAAGIDPAVFVDVGKQSSPTAWSPDCSIQSRYAADGSVEHFITWRIERTAASSLLISLPQGWNRSNVRSIWIDRTRLLPGEAPTTSSGQIAIDLPPLEESSTLELSLAGTTNRLTSVGRLQAAVPKLNVPVLGRRWTVWLPAGYQICGEDSARGSLSIGQRLCGWFGRDARDATFNPLKVAQWKALFVGPADAQTRLPPIEAPANVIEANAPGSPRAMAADNGMMLDTAFGWTNRTIAFQDGSCSAVYVYRPTIAAAAWIGFLATFGIGVWKMAQSPRIIVFLAAAGAIAALLVPPPWTSVASSLLLGFLCTLMWRIVAPWMALRRKESAMGRGADAASTISAMLPFGAPLLAAVLLTPALVSHAAEPAASIGISLTGTSAAMEPAKTYDVLIPLDANKKPVGRNFYLPEDLYKTLYQDSRKQNDKPQGVLLASALYKATLASSPTTQTYTVEKLTADFNLHAFGPARVRVPFRRDEIKLAPGEAEVDGRPIQPEWDLDGTSLLIDMDEAGEHSLKIGMRPTIRSVSGANGFQITIPRVASARAEVELSPRGPAIEFPTARGAVRWDEEPARWSVQLGPVDQFAVRWPDVADAIAPVVEAEQFYWLRVLPGSVLMDATLNLKLIAGHIDRLQIKTDPDLELLPLTGADAPSIDIRRSAGQGQLITLHWPHPLHNASSLELHFLCTGASSIGKLRTPQIELPDVRSSRRWLAVSIDPALEHSPPSGAGLTAMAVSEFASDRKATTLLPQYAFLVTTSNAVATLSTRPRHTETTVVQSELLTCGEHQVGVALDADLATPSGHIVQYLLDAPHGLKIQSISIVADGLQRVARWSQDSSGQITVFTTAPVAGRQQFQLRGELPFQAKLPLPRFRFIDSTTIDSTVRIVRRPEVIAEVRGEIAKGPSQTATEPKWDGLDSVGHEATRLVGMFRDDNLPPDRVTLSLRPNRPKIEGVETTSVAFVSGHIQATVDCQLKAGGAAIDAVTLDVSKSWHGPFEVTGGTMAASSDDQANREHLTVASSGASNEEFKFSISAPLSEGLAGEISVPDVVIEKTSKVRRLVILPNENEEQSPAWAWTLRGLRKTTDHLPSGLGRGTAYEVVAGSWQAVRTPGARSTAPPQVRQKFVRLAWHSGGGCLLASRWQLVGARRGEHMLNLPEGFTLLRLMVDDLPVDPRRLDSGAWVVPIAFDRPAAQVDALCFAAAAFPELSSGWPHYLQFQAPKLGELAVDKTSWIVAGPADMARGQLEDMPAGVAESAPSEFLAATAADFTTPAQSETQYSAKGDIETITLRYAPEVGLTWPATALWAAAILAAALLALQVLRDNLLWRILVRRPYLIGIATGLVWWLCLAPSVLGLLLVVVSFAARFVRWPQPHRV